MDYTQNNEKYTFRQKVAELLRKRKDPEYVKYAFEQMGYDTATIEQELSGIANQLDTGAEEPSINTAGLEGYAKVIAEGQLDYDEFKSDTGVIPTVKTQVTNDLIAAGFDISGGGKEEDEGIGTIVATEEGKAEAQKSIYNHNQNKIGTDTARQSYNYGTRMLQSSEILSGTESNIASKGVWAGFNQWVDEKQAGHTLTQRFVPEEFQKVDQAQRNFINAVLRRESGAVINPDEFENARKQYFPVPGDENATLIQKRKNREQVIKNFLGQAGIPGNLVETAMLSKKDIEEATKKGDETTTETEEVAQPKTIDEQAYEWVLNNPDDPRADKILKKLDQKGFVRPDTQEKREVGEYSKRVELSPEAEKEKSKIWSKAGKLVKGVGDFLGVSKLGEGIGLTIYLQSKEGKELQEKAEKGDTVAIEVLTEILDEAPSAKEVIGSAALTALNIGTAGVAGGLLKGASTLTKVGTGIATGGAFGAAGGMEQDKEVKDIATSAGIGAAVGGAISWAGVGIEKWKQAKRATRPKEIQDAVGQIVQGKPKDKQAALNTLKNIDTSDVKTYEQLSGKIDDRLVALDDSMTSALEQDDKLRKLSQLTSKVGNKKVNYVTDALQQLDDLYSKTNDYANEDRIKNLVLKAKDEGLSLLEVNNIAKEHAMARNAFTKAGELSTGVNKQSYENIRKGVKGVIRRILPGDEAKDIDWAFHETLNTKSLIDKVVEKANGLEQKIQKRGLFEKGGRFVGKAGEKIPVVGGGAKGFLQAFIPSNAGNKTMNSLALQEALKKNLKVIEKNGDKVLRKITDRISTGGPITQAFIQNLLRELSD